MHSPPVLSRVVPPVVQPVASPVVPLAPQGAPRVVGPVGTSPVAAAGPDAGEGARFRILGPVEFHDERTGLRVRPLGAKQRAVLGVLLVKAGQVVSAHRLIDEVWGEHPPAHAGNALQAHVARLRRVLAAAAVATGEPPRDWVTTRSLGYVLRLGGATTDADLFHRLAAEGRAAAVDDPGRAVDLLRRALSLWRGPALEGSVRGSICATEAALLEESRLTALEALYDACLRTGRHHGITGELEELVGEHPVRERFYDLLMVALYRCGRQAEALGVYDRARKHLALELGVEPGPVLRGRMEAVLHHDPALVLPGPADPFPAAARRPPAAPALLAAVPRRPAAPAVSAPFPAPDHCHEAAVLSLVDEVARLRRHVERLTSEQEALVRRVDRLSALAATSWSSTATTSSATSVRAG
ncbi:AfsR/SARP family transcriptional regulator [Streptomyces hilarionis]|uniref:AfsR/SARP family transcriptional regulator n=1 Tax=Streptomyces hilarionis TaxID=2839954 RepID=UPI002119EEF5|nr:AfsR/SARP family transcriptional regulator [Streptomyces hilarionis]